MNERYTLHPWSYVTAGVVLAGMALGLWHRDVWTILMALGSGLLIVHAIELE